MVSVEIMHVDRHFPPAHVADLPHHLSAQQNPDYFKPNSGMDTKESTEINKRTFKCPIVNQDGSTNESLRCTLVKDDEHLPYVYLERSNPMDNTPLLSVAQISGSNHIIINYSGSNYARADWVCRMDTATDTLLYPEFDPKLGIIDPYIDKSGNPLSVDSKNLIQDACFAATLDPQIIPINGRNVVVQPNQSGTIAIFETVPNSVNPSNPTVRIQSKVKDVSGNEKIQVLLEVDLMTLLRSLAYQELSISGTILSLPNPSLPLPSLTLPDKIISKFNLTNPTIWTNTENGGVSIDSQPEATEIYTATPNQDGIIVPDNSANNEIVEPARIVDIDGTTTHDIVVNLTCTKGSKVSVIRTNADTPLAAQLRYEISESQTYNPSWNNHLAMEIAKAAKEYNSKLPILLKQILRYNTDTPYTIENCKDEDVNMSFSLLYQNFDNKNNLTILGLDPFTNDLVYLKIKAKDAKKYLNISASVSGIPDPAMTNELMRQLYMFSENKYGPLTKGTIMIPANSVPNLPKDTSLDNLSIYAKNSHFGTNFPTTVIDNDGHQHKLELPTGIPMRVVTTQLQNGSYTVTLEADLSKVVSQLDLSTYQIIIDIYGQIPNRMLVQYPQVNLYTSYTSPGNFYYPPEITPTPTLTPTSSSSQLEKIHEQQTSLNLHRQRQQSLIRSQQKNYQYKV